LLTALKELPFHKRVKPPSSYIIMAHLGFVVNLIKVRLDRYDEWKSPIVVKVSLSIEDDV
jgi:hypothetical protein